MGTQTPNRVNGLLRNRNPHHPPRNILGGPHRHRRRPALHNLDRLRLSPSRMDKKSASPSGHNSLRATLIRHNSRLLDPSLRPLAATAADFGQLLRGGGAVLHVLPRRFRALVWRMGV